MVDSFGRYYKIVTSSENYAAVLSKLREEGITFEPDNGFELLPMSQIEVRRYCILGFQANPTRFLIFFFKFWFNRVTFKLFINL